MVLTETGEPLFDGDPATDSSRASNPAVRPRIQSLLDEQPYAVLMQTGIAAEEFVQRYDDLQERFLDVAYDDERLHDRPGPLLRNLVELSRRPRPSIIHEAATTDFVAALEEQLLTAVGAERRAEAMDVIETGRVSWRLRDDDNLLVARLDSQLLRALEVAATRLRDLGKLTGDGHPRESHLAPLVRGLRDPSTGPITIETRAKSKAPTSPVTPPGETPRQLIGQPASPGLATGLVRCVYGREDLGKFRQGDILVCDAIQPTMTHLVPLAGAIVERRGGMLIHGAIIARELGIPCVNGVGDAAVILKNGDLVTVDGYLGIVTIGTADFELEMHADCATPNDRI